MINVYLIAMHLIIIVFFISSSTLRPVETQLHCKYIQFKCSESVVKKPENCNSPAYFPFNDLHTCNGSTLENWDTVKSCTFGGSWKYLQCNLPFFFAKKQVQQKYITNWDTMKSCTLVAVENICSVTYDHFSSRKTRLWW